MPFWISGRMRYALSASAGVVVDLVFDVATGSDSALTPEDTVVHAYARQQLLRLHMQITVWLQQLHAMAQRAPPMRGPWHI